MTAYAYHSTFYLFYGWMKAKISIDLFHWAPAESAVSNTKYTLCWCVISLSAHSVDTECHLAQTFFNRM